jgi:hypothetical protein
MMFVAIITGVLYHMVLTIQTLCSIICLANYYLPSQWNMGGGGGGVPTTQNSEVLTKLSKIPSSVENTSITT